MKKTASLIAICLVALAAVAAGPAAARVKRSAAPTCADQPTTFSWDFLLTGGNPPRPNGCSPPVYTYGKNIGQDPDPNVRLQMLRDPGEGDLSFQR